jgi:hypothetical protein
VPRSINVAPAEAMRFSAGTAAIARADSGLSVAAVVTGAAAAGGCTGFITGGETAAGPAEPGGFAAARAAWACGLTGGGTETHGAVWAWAVPSAAGSCAEGPTAQCGPAASADAGAISRLVAMRRYRM